VLNWASDEVKADADKIDEHMESIIDDLKAQYAPKK
jgi:hypothetical protein